MGNKVVHHRPTFGCRLICKIIGVMLLCVQSPAAAQADEDSNSRPAVGVEIWASSDADQTNVFKLLAQGLWKFGGRDNYQGLAVERVRFSFKGQDPRTDHRIYLDAADDIDRKWLWNARIGTDGNTVLGSANMRTADWKQSYFLERDIVETPRGVNEGIYYTFIGASHDFSLDKRNIVTLMAGMQEFTGKNYRIHTRANYIHVLKEDWGLSLQLRGRYYHSTRPNEFDYYSPRDFLQVVPAVQVRRFSRTGWMFQLRGGYGAQYATGGSWRDARLAEFRIESPPSSNDLRAFVDFHYSNNSVLGGPNYDYTMGRIGMTLGI